MKTVSTLALAAALLAGSLAYATPAGAQDKAAAPAAPGAAPAAPAASSTSARKT